jgi:N-acetylglucosamine repressor
MRTTTTRPGLRELNNGQILRAIVREGPLTRVDLVRCTGLTAAAISNITRELIERGWLREIGISRGKGAGANAILLDLPHDTPVVGVIHQGVSALRLALCNLRGQILDRRSIATPERYTSEWAVTTITQVLQELLSANGYGQEAVIGIGAGLVGLIDVQRGIVKRAPSLGWEAVAFGDLLAQRLHCAVMLENNVRAMAFGEALFGNGRSWSDFAFVYVGTGIGSGLIINGRPYHGTHGGAGEIGHITVEQNGEVCSCGNYGCLETIVAEPAIVRHALQQGIALKSLENGPKKAVEELVMLALAGDERARDIIMNCGESLGTALANLVDLLNPSRIVLHGAVTAANGLFFPAVSDCIQRRAFLTRDEVVVLEPATFGSDAGLVGAAAVALDAIVLGGDIRDVTKYGIGAA